VLPTIQATLIRQKTTAAQQSYAQQLTSEAIKNGLQKTAEAHHLQLVTTPPVSEQSTIPGLPESTGLLSRAFQSKPNDPAQSAPTGDGYAIFQVTGIIPAHAPTFAEWKSHVLDDYRAEQLPALLRQKTNELATQAHNTNDLAKAAKAVGAEVKTSDLVGMSGQVPQLGDVGQVAPQLFDLSVGNISGPINAGRTGVVAKIVDKQEPTADEIAKNLDQTRDQLLDQRRGEAFQIFATNVMDDYRKHRRVLFNAKARNQEVPGE
jgi:peptidyl-prolyl cis-trans isomerase D